MQIGVSKRSSRYFKVIFSFFSLFINTLCMRGSRGGAGGPDPTENHKNVGFLRNTGPNPLKITKPAFNIGPSLASQRNAISMAFCCHTNDGQLIVVFSSYLPSSTKKNKKKHIVKVGHPRTKLSGSA